MPADGSSRMVPPGSSPPKPGGRGCRPPKPRGRSAERRILVASAAGAARRKRGSLRRARRHPAGATPSGAPPRRFWALGPFFRARTGSLPLALIPAAFAAVHPVLVQPYQGRPHVVGADGDPRPPGDAVASHTRGRRLPRSACRTPPEAPSDERGCGDYSASRNKVKDYFPRIPDKF
jgi:hypothetical protein